VLELRPLLHFKAQPATAIQIADHGFDKNADRFGVLGPFQLLAMSQKLFERIAEPEQIGFTLAHGVALLLLSPRGNGGMKCKHCANLYVLDPRPAVTREAGVN
jgi:hypothetical protein